jgi:hypothetical protein
MGYPVVIKTHSFILTIKSQLFLYTGEFNATCFALTKAVIRKIRHKSSDYVSCIVSFNIIDVYDRDSNFIKIINVYNKPKSIITKLRFV